MPLKIELKPGEKFIVNGAVMVAGKTGASLALRNHAVLLRGRDVMQEAEATTPARRLYFTLMLMYIDPDNRAVHGQNFARFRPSIWRRQPFPAPVPSWNASVASPSRTTTTPGSSSAGS
jgi:flagellar biosynthesis regulator FlbT